MPYGIGCSHGQRIGSLFKCRVFITCFIGSFFCVDRCASFCQRVGIGVRILAACCLSIPVNGVFCLSLRKIRVECIKAQFLQQHTERFSCKGGTVVLRIEHIHLQCIICSDICICAKHIIGGIRLRRRLLPINKQLKVITVGLHAALRRCCPGNGIIKIGTFLIRNSGDRQPAFRLSDSEFFTDVVI